MTPDEAKRLEEMLSRWTVGVQGTDRKAVLWLIALAQSEAKRADEKPDVIADVDLLLKIDKLTHDRDAALATLAEAEASCAGMREALESLVAAGMPALAETLKRHPEREVIVVEKVRAALGSDAGRAMQERVNFLEQENAELKRKIRE